MMPLEAQLPFLNEKGHVVSLVGGGGKTTLLYAMAQCCAAKGWRVLVSTTTHIQRPETGWVQTREERNARWNNGTYAVAGLPAEHGKLQSLPDGTTAALDAGSRPRAAGSRWREMPALQGSGGA